MQGSHSTYHSFLRVSAAVLALVLVFQSGLLSSYTAELALETQSYMANTIGVTAGVEPTELNMYTAELTKREQELDAREAALAERELDTGLGGAIVSTAEADTTTFFLSVILFILLVLIVLNYVLDYLRAQERRVETTATTA